MNKRFTSLMTTLILSVFFAVSASADVVEVDGIYYDYYWNGTAHVVYICEGYYKGDIVIPESIIINDKKYSVTSIGNQVFSGCSDLTSITIPNSVTSIGNNAFSGCSSLTYITIPNSVTSIGSWALQGCVRLTSVTIPNSVTSIGDGAFSNCSGLTSITIPNSVTSIGNWALQGCVRLTSVTIPNSVTSIGFGAFRNCSGLTSIIIPNSIISIQGDTFLGCSGLTSVSIPNSVTSIGYSAFSGCVGLTSITIPNSVTSIGNGAFQDCVGLTSVTIPNFVTSIGDQTFKGCCNLASISISNSVTSIGSGTFEGCTSLTSITIPNSVTSIGDSAFSYCSGLTSITIPNSVTWIGNSAFSDCSSLTSITIPNTVTNIGDGILRGSKINNTIIINDLLVSLSKDYDGHYLIPNNITKILGYAFENCRSLTSVTIPNSVTSIGCGAFRDCSGLTSVTIPNSVTSIEYSAFYGCTGLKSVTIPNSVTSIEDRTFYGCSSLTSVTIPNSVTRIGDSAFFNCNMIRVLNIDTSVHPGIYSILNELNFGDNIDVVYDNYKDMPLQKISLGKNISEIQTEAFYNSKIEEFSITGEKTIVWYPNVFGSQDLSNATLYVPESKIGYYQTTEPWSKFGKILTLSGDTPTEPEKCATPSISFSEGQLLFSCDTEGAKCYYTLNNSDVKKVETLAESNSANLSACYDITCYAKAEGYVNSDVATAKLYWLPSSGTLETDNINTAAMRGIAIQSAGGFINISGLDNNEKVDFYAADGKALGSAKSIDGSVSFSAQQGTIIIAKIGKESVKISVE